MNKVYSAMLAMLGFTACDPFNTPKMYGPQPAEYGTPYAEFSLKGGVSDESGTPIDRIRVVMKPLENSNHLNDTVYTKEDGKYAFEKRDLFGLGSIRVMAADIDGEENGGEFQTKTEIVPIKNSDYTGGEGWFRGRAEKTVDFTLEKVEQEDDETE